MKLALLLNTINPKIGGVLIRGKKGTAKSTAVRSLAALLPEVTVLQGCPYSCSPDARQGLCQWCQSGANDNPPVNRQVRIVDLPVGATEDRLVGSLDIEQAIKTGDRSFEPGLLAATHRGILYIDEVNLLNDHLVDVLLDAAAMGRNYVEREGISITHGAEFILVGTMNPEEGDLRPQLLDRFGLAVEVEGNLTAEERREVVRRRIAYEADAFKFMARWRKEEERERRRLLRSQRLLRRVSLDDEMLTLITDICAGSEVDGMRGDIVMYKTASTIAAYEGRTKVTTEDVRQAAQLALLHRQRRQPFQQPQMVTEQLDSMIDELQHQPRQREPSDNDSNSGPDKDDGDPHQPDQTPDEPLDEPLDESRDQPDEDPQEQPQDPDDAAEDWSPQDQVFEVGALISIASLQVQPPDRRARRSTGRRAKTVSGSSIGRYVSARPPVGDVTDRVNLTPVALAEGMTVARRLFGGLDQVVDYEYIPSAVFSAPPVGTVGLSEDEARHRGLPVKIFRSDFRPMIHTLSGRNQRTLMKLVVHADSDRVLGCHMVGPEAGEIIQGFAVAMRAGATKRVFDTTVGIHPTAAEEFVTMRTPTR
jgi:magnesium chelatase subunit D